MTNKQQHTTEQYVTAGILAIVAITMLYWALKPYIYTSTHTTTQHTVQPTVNDNTSTQDNGSKGLAAMQQWYKINDPLYTVKFSNNGTIVKVRSVLGTQQDIDSINK